MFMYLHTKFQVFSIILMSSRQGVSSGGGIILPVKRTLKSQPRLGLNNAFDFPHAPTAFSVGTGFGLPKN